MFCEEYFKCELDKSIEYYIETIFVKKIKDHIMNSAYYKEAFVSEIVFEMLPKDDRADHNTIFIENLLTFPQYRHKGYGKALLADTAKCICEINKKTESKTVSISGILELKDYNFWKYSLPRYSSFAKSVIGPNAVCLINGNQTEEDILAETAYKINENNTAVNFEFAAK